MNNIKTKHIETIAWMAGFFDGEGYIGIAKYNLGFVKHRWGGNFPKYVITVNVTNNDKNSVIVFKDNFEGQIYHNAKVYRWAIEGSSRVKTFVDTIYPYSVTKKPQLDIAIEFFNIPRITPGRKDESGLVIGEFLTSEYERLYQKFKEIKGKSGHRGRPSKWVENQKV